MSLEGQGKIYIIAGRTKTGKTTEAIGILRSLPENMPKYIHDIKGDFKRWYNKPYENVKTFLPKIKSVQNSLIIFEEAGIAFGHALPEKVKEAVYELCQCARTRNNILVFIFHSLRNCPLWAIQNSDWLIIKKTQFDNDKRFKDYPAILSAMQRVKNSSNFHETVYIDVQNEL